MVSTTVREVCVNVKTGKLSHKAERSRSASVRKRTLASIAAVILVACVALLTVHPYARLGRLAQQMVREHAPAGMTISDITVSFPSNIVLTNLVLPVQVNDQLRQVRVEKASGQVSILSLLRGMVNAEMNSDFFGGLLWVKFRTEPSPEGSPVAFEARARKMDISQLCDFFQAPVKASGRCDLDVEAEVDEHDVRKLNGKALALGNQIEVPPLELDKLSLPTNREGKLNAKLSAGNGKILIQNFKFDGTAYNLSGQGEIILSEPFEQSRLKCSASGIFKEHFSINDDRLQGAQQIADTLVATQSELFFKIGGTIEKPDVQLDAGSSVGSLMQHLQR